MVNILIGISFILIALSLTGFVNSIIKKKSKTKWIGLTLISILLPFVILVAFGESKGTLTKYDQNEKEKPTIESDGTIKMKQSYTNYIVGEDIEEGKYDVEIDDVFGNIQIVGKKDLSSNLRQKLGLENIVKLRVVLHNGDEIMVEDPAIFIPAKDEKFVYEELMLYPGTWIVGDDIAPGKYNLSSTTDSIGEVSIFQQDRRIADGFIGEGINPPTQDIELFEGDKIQITKMNFKLVPKNK